MRPKSLLIADSSENGTIRVATQGTDVIYVNGASMPVSANVDGHYREVHSFVLRPQMGKMGVVALSVRRTSSKNRDAEMWIPFLLEVQYPKGEKPRINLEDEWVPPVIAQADTGHVEVVIGKYCFTNKKPIHDFEQEQYAEKGIRYVPDPNLLCKFLVGEVSAQTVRHAATKFAKGESAVTRLAEVEDERDALSMSVSELDRELCQERTRNMNIIRELGKIVNGRGLFCRRSTLRALWSEHLSPYSPQKAGAD